jgi:tRNA(Arg) A34 adenosine deaminase TadA
MAKGRNLGKQEKDPTAHGEMVAIRRFLARYGPDKLKGTTLYTSGESCAMCMGAILWCGISRLVYGASIAELAAKIGQIMVTDAEIADNTPFAEIAITGGVLAAESCAVQMRLGIGIGPGAAAEEGRNADGAARDAASGCRSTSDRRPADDNRAFRRGLAHDDRVSRRGLAGNGNGGRRTPGGGSDRAGIGAQRNDGRCNEKCRCES